MFEIRLVQVEEVLKTRQKVLRPLWHPEQCLHPEDLNPLSFHLAGFFGGRIISVASFHPQSHPDLHGGFPFRLRGMATDKAYQGQGHGGILLQRGVDMLRQKGCDLLWANARIGAFSFYQREGFSFWGSLFEIDGIGPHKVMYKHLIPR